MPRIGLLEGQRLRFRLGAAEFTPEEWSARGGDPHDRAKRTTDWAQVLLDDGSGAASRYQDANRGSLDPESEPDILDYLRNHGGVPQRSSAPAVSVHDVAKATTDWAALYRQSPSQAQAAYFEANRGSLDPEFEPTVEVWLRNHGGIPSVTPMVVPSDPGVLNPSQSASTTNPPLMTDAEYQKFLADQIAYANSLAAQPRDPSYATAFQPDPAPAVIEASPEPDAAADAPAAPKSALLPLLALAAAWMVLK